MYKTIGGTRSNRAQDGDKEKIDLEFLKNWAKSGSDSLSSKASTHPDVTGHEKSKPKLDAKKPGQGSESTTGSKPEPAKTQKQPGDAKGAALPGSAAKGLPQGPDRKTATSEKSKKPAKLPKPSKLAKPVEKATQMPQAGMAGTAGAETASVTQGTETGEASSQPLPVKKRLPLLSSLLRPSSPKKSEKAPGPSKMKRPSSAKDKYSESASPQKKTSGLTVSKEGKGSPRHKPKPVAQKANEGSRQAPTSNSRAKVQPRQHEQSSPAEGVTRSQSMENVSINKVVNFYEQRISQLHHSAGPGMTAAKTPTSNLQQSRPVHKHGHQGREGVDCGLYTRAYHSMMDLSVAAAGPLPEPTAESTAESTEAPPNAPSPPPPPLPAGDGNLRAAQDEPRPAVQRRRRKSFVPRPVTWALDDIEESRGEVHPPPLTQGGGDR